MTGAGTTLLTERSATWVPLNEDLTFLDRRRQFVWASSRSGFQHLYLYDEEGRLVRPLTQGDRATVGDRGASTVRGVDEPRGLLYFSSPGDNPRERQLYRVSIDRPGEPVAVTKGSGWHAVSMADDASVFLDTFSDTDTPPTLRLHRADGRLLSALVPNALAPGHPYFPHASSMHARFRDLTAADGHTLHYGP